MLRQDQEILYLFKNMKLGSLGKEDEDGLLLRDIQVSLEPSKVEFENYDHEMSFDQKDYIGFEMKDLKFVGKGTATFAD